MSGKTPKELYVVLKEQYEYENGKRKPVGNLLGFAHEYAPTTQAFRKKKETQLDWAYGRIGNAGYELIGDEVYIRPYTENQWTGGTHRKVDVAGYKVPSHLQPRIIKNDPIDGFTVCKSVSRYSTSNKVWRILDPRGFELEISTDCMEDLLMEGTVSKGVIHGLCQWHTGKILRYVN